jgi:hypothetical protein
MGPGDVGSGRCRYWPMSNLLRWSERMSLIRRLPDQSTAMRLVPAYVLWLLPALLAVILDWSAWLTVVFFMPGIAWYCLGEGVRSYRDLRLTSPNAPVGRYVPALSALSLFVVAVLFASRFAGVIIVAGFAYVDLVALCKRAIRLRGSAVQR